MCTDAENQVEELTGSELNVSPKLFMITSRTRLVMYNVHVHVHENRPAESGLNSKVNILFIII